MSSDTEHDSELESTEDLFFSGNVSSQQYKDPLHEAMCVLEAKKSAYIQSDELSSALFEMVNIPDITGGNKDKAMDFFQHIVTIQTLNDLLAIRKQLRLGKETTHGITWVDTILARLGQLVTIFIQPPEQSLPPQINASSSEKFQDFIDQDAAFAASYVPDIKDCFQAFSSVFNTRSLPPATKRLVLRLIYAIVTIQQENHGYDAQEVADALESSVEEYVQFDPTTGSSVIMKPILDCALFLNLYATIVIQLRMKGLGDHHLVSRPYFESHCLAMLGHILHSDPTASVGHENRVGQYSLLQHGMFVPWSWEVWSDTRFADTELIVVLTLLWLDDVEFHGGDCVHAHCKRIVHVLHMNLTSTLVALSNVLCYMESELEESTGVDEESLKRLGQIYSLLSFLLHEISLKESITQEALEPHISNICKSSLILCVTHLGLVESSSTCCDLLAVLATIEEKICKTCLAELQKDHRLMFSSRVDAFFTKVKTTLSLEGGLSPESLVLIRSALIFLTILCSAGTRGTILRENVSSLILPLYNHCISREKASHELLTPLINALVKMEEYFHALNIISITQCERLWDLISQHGYSHIIASLAQAQYIMHRMYFRDQLRLCEALNHFRGLILATFNQHIPDDLAEVANLACPTFCVVIMHLLAASGEMRDLLAVTDNIDDRRRCLREKLSDIGKTFLATISMYQLDTLSTGPVPVLPNRLLSYGSDVMIVNTVNPDVRSNGT